MVFEIGVKNIQAAAYNGARTVDGNYDLCENVSNYWLSWLYQTY
jgi:hypothetical protein